MRIELMPGIFLPRWANRPNKSNKTGTGLAQTGVSHSLAQQVKHRRLLNAVNTLVMLVCLSAFATTVVQGADLSIKDLTVDEKQQTANITIELSEAATEKVFVNFSTQPDTAVNGQDFYGTFKVVEFAPGQTSNEVSLVILNDTAFESEERFTARIWGAQGANIARAVATIVIVDDDADGGSPECTVTERAGRIFRLSWQDTGVFKYIVQRSVNASPWYWRGAVFDNNDAEYVYVDDTSPAAPRGARVEYRVMAKVVDESSPLVELANCDAEQTERLSTGVVNGRWQLIDNQSGQIVHWNAVNVRTDKFIGSSPKLLGSEDFAAIATVFNAIRVPIHWDDMHIGSGRFNTVLRSRVLDILDHAQRHGIDVILDPVHLGGGDNFWMPEWVWEKHGYPQNRANSFNLLQGEEIHEYLDWIMTTGLGTHPAVVAIEVVNEPHPVGSSGAWRRDKQIALLAEYKKMVNTVRSRRPNVVVVLGAYYGGHLFDNGLGEANPLAEVFTDIANPVENLVWTAHNYFTGIESNRVGPDYDKDGLPDIDGQGYRGTRGAGVWTETFDSFGCYAQNPPYSSSPFNCNATLPLRNQAKRGHAANAANHDRVAQAANMPFFMGEFGVGKLRSNNTIGWSGAEALLCDKLVAYNDITADGTNKKISWAAWAFDSRVDGGFGLYNGQTNQWEPQTSPPFLGRCP